MLGLSPRQVDEMHLGEYAAAIAAYNRANGAEEKPAAPTPDEHDALVAKYG